VTVDWRVIVSAAIGLSISAGIVLAIEECWRMRRSGTLTRPALREMMLSLGALPPNLVISVLMTGCWTLIYARATSRIPWHLPMNAWTLMSAFVAADCCYYWEHRCAHRSRLLWKLYHAVHHGSSAFTVATAYRVSFINQFVAPIFYVPCLLAGFDPLLIVALQLLNIHYQAWVHTELIGRLGMLDRIFNTPANHRMHHDAALRPHGANFAGILSVWDRLFGTYVPPGPVHAYGIAGMRAPHDLLEMYAAPFRARDGVVFEASSQTPALDPRTLTRTRAGSPASSIPASRASQAR
jgi:sterol desaturase/sphingolipid hydroxylase (fatty acid hydroxylase superfamily)